MSNKKLADRLDWSALLGFEQVVDTRNSVRSSGSQRLGAKVGGKPGVKPEIRLGSKAGIKQTIRIGTKAGIKPTIRIGTKTGQKPIG